MSKLGIVFGTNDGDAKNVAEYIGQKLNGELLNATELTVDFLNNHEKLIFVASTHKYGELQKDFKAKLDIVAEADFKGKVLALVGLGGQERHPDTFNDGLVEFLPLIRGAKLVGAYEDPGYNYTNSLSFINGKFIGLVLDYKADSAWQEKTNQWIDSIKANF